MLPPQTRSNIRPSLAPSSAKARQLQHLASQLAQLQTNLADLEDISRVTAVQAENIKTLGSLNASLLMAAGKVLGESGAGMHSPPEPEPEAGEDEEMMDA